MPCHHEFRRMLSAEGVKPESNNRTKSDLGHVGRRFVGGWVSGYVWYCSRVHLVTPRCVVSRPDTARAARRPCIVSWLRPCRRPLPQGAGRPGPAGSAELGHIRMSGAVSDGWNTSGTSPRVLCRDWRASVTVFGILSRTKARSATNEVPKCRSQ